MANKNEADDEPKSAEAYNTITHASRQQFQEYENVWIADSGASMHMTPHKEVFREIQPANKFKFVKAAGGRIMPVSGTGTVDISVNINGKEEDRQLLNVLLVPDLQYNLFSVSAVTRKGYSFHADNERCEIRRSNGDLSAVGVRYGEMYKMLLKTKKQIECLVVEEKSLKLWHERMGHINVSAIKKTDNLKAVTGMKINQNTKFFCEPCVLGKQSRISHYSSERSRVDTPGEMIHSDVRAKDSAWLRCQPLKPNMFRWQKELRRLYG
ncbi:hypothetical protein KPH14_012292 [Odynerus spinipes]|uniref:GAG-pre-integrase domain-containing protein n=1 Tax=Odynerus spinipes TaxID=1348599 RepID=A0AAD9VKT3_9HYME|nr:hypothetical protein KPH14_012292 [Odynerus spinipes]